ncbi:XtrA/YqaO family protein [Bacillus sp. NPDC077027]|uniref:XtrA/YqaO family protein n=1 Tax=Bacillus sp. NPDC077027 TaxID=3390548 RepID=UPI003D060923
MPSHGETKIVTHDNKVTRVSFIEGELFKSVNKTVLPESRGALIMTAKRCVVGVLFLFVGKEKTK